VPPPFLHETHRSVPFPLEATLVLLRYGQVLTRSSEVTSPRTTNVRCDIYFLQIPHSSLDRLLTFWSFFLGLFCFALFTVAIAILSFYGGVTVLYKISSAMSSKPVVEEKVVAKVEAPTTGIPGIESAAFEKWVETDAFTQLLENEVQLTALVESL
jgi:hypothetical protein